MKTKLLYWLAIITILSVGVIHLMLAQEEYEEVAYMGYLFAANFFGAAAAAFGIFRRQGWGWMLGGAIAAASMAGRLPASKFPDRIEEGKLDNQTCDNAAKEALLQAGLEDDRHVDQEENQDNLDHSVDHGESA